VVNLGGYFLIFIDPLRQRIQVDKLDQAFRRLIEQHDDLQYLHHFLSRAFSVLPSY
jgi:hypothetical protein